MAISFVGVWLAFLFRQHPRTELLGWGSLGLFGLALGGQVGVLRQPRKTRPQKNPPATELAAPPPDELRDAKHWETTADLLQNGMLLLDEDNRILRANPAAAAMLGVPHENMAGTPLHQIPEVAPIKKLIAAVRENCTDQAADFECPKSGLYLHAIGIPLHASDAACTGMISILLCDVSRLHQLERASEEYATNVSHELKTPLTLILGYTETLLAHEELDVEFRRRALRTIDRHTQRILRIIDDLLRLAWLKGESDSVGIPRANVAVAQVVNAAVELCHQWAQSAGIGIEADVPADLMWSLNAGLMEQALVNLLKNAILYALTGPIEIQAHINPGGHLELAVKDRGPGLKPDDASKIFDRFYRSDKGRPRTSGGSGLGLPIVQQIIGAHRGTARVETEPGVGCTFILTIPAHPPGAPAP